MLFERLVSRYVIGGVPVANAEEGDLTVLWSADFKNGIYEVAGVPVALADMFAENTDWDSWSSDSVTPGVGMALNSGPVIIGDALAAVIGGATYVADVVLGTADPGFGANPFQFALTDVPGYVGQAVLYTAQGTDANPPLLYGNYDKTASIPYLTEGVLNRIAVTLALDKIVYSVGGANNVSLASDILGAHDIVAFNGRSSGVLEKLVARAVQPDAALPGLSV
jgi:hypothetical protein